MSFSPARSLMISQESLESLRLRIALPLIFPGITNGLLSTRGIVEKTRAASGDSEVVRGLAGSAQGLLMETAFSRPVLFP